MGAKALFCGSRSVKWVGGKYVGIRIGGGKCPVSGAGQRGVLKSLQEKIQSCNGFRWERWKVRRKKFTRPTIASPQELEVSLAFHNDNRSGFTFEAVEGCGRRGRRGGEGGAPLPAPASPTSPSAPYWSYPWKGGLFQHCPKITRPSYSVPIMSSQYNDCLLALKVSYIVYIW